MVFVYDGRINGFVFRTDDSIVFCDRRTYGNLTEERTNLFSAFVSRGLDIICLSSYGQGIGNGYIVINGCEG